jgi:hypothetical protein
VSVLSDIQIARYAFNAGFRGADLATAVAITHPESGGDPSAVQQGQPAATTGWGLWQITPGDSSLLDPQANASAAFDKFKAANGFSPWTTYVDGKYRQFLDAAQQAASNMAAAPTSPSVPMKAGSGLLSGLQADPWGIGQGIADAVGYTGSTVGSIGRTAQNSGTLLVGLLILGAGVAVLGWMFLQNTDAGRGIKRVSKDAAVAAVTVAK